MAHNFQLSINVLTFSSQSDVDIDKISKYITKEFIHPLISLISLWVKKIFYNHKLLIIHKPSSILFSSLITCLVVYCKDISRVCLPCHGCILISCKYKEFIKLPKYVGISICEK